MLKESKHTCTPDVVRNCTDGVMDQTKKEVCLNLGPVHKYLKKLSEKLSVDNIPIFTIKKDTLYLARRKFLKVNKTRCIDFKDFRLPDHIVNDFFIYDDCVDD